MANRATWTEERISRLQQEGRGEGARETYRPWVQVGDFSSAGRARRVWSHLTNREHHLLSDVEYGLFLHLEFARDVVDIREQFPLPRELTQDVAQELGIRHPCYPGTHIAAVLTVDFVATHAGAGQEVDVAYDAKRADFPDTTRTLEKLELARAALAKASIAHHVVLHSDISKTQTRNIEWMRSGQIHEKEAVPFVSYWDELRERMLVALSNVGPQKKVIELCIELDSRWSAEPGTALRTVKLLSFDKTIKFDLATSSIEALQVGQVSLPESRTGLKVVGAK